MSTNTLLAWVDIETTGLDEDDHVLEFAMILTDDSLNIVAPPLSTLVQPTEATFERLNANTFVREMHTNNGLLHELQASMSGTEHAPTLEQLDGIVAGLVTDAKNKVGASVVHIAGGGVAAFDQPLVKRAMPQFASTLHYRPIDISIVTGTYRYATGDTSRFAKTPGKAHRALADIKEDLDVARAVWDLFRSAVPDPNVNAVDRVFAAASLVYATVTDDGDARRDLLSRIHSQDMIGGSTALSAYLASELAAERGTSVSAVLDEVRKHAAS